MRVGLPGRLAGERRRRRPAQGHGGGVRARHQPLRLCLDAAGDGGGQRPQPQLRRPQQALSGERGLSRDRRLPGSGRPRPGRHRRRRRQACRLSQEGGRRRLFPRGVRRPVQSSRRHVLRRRRAQLVEPHAACHHRPLPERSPGRRRHRFPYRPRPLWLRRADHPLRHQHAGVAPGARLLGRVGDEVQARPDGLAGARWARALRPQPRADRARDPAHHVHPGIRHVRSRKRPEGLPRRPLAAQVRRPAGQGSGPGAGGDAPPVLPGDRRLEGGRAVPRPSDRPPGHRRRAARRRSRRGALASKNILGTNRPRKATRRASDPAKSLPCVFWWR